MSFINIYTKKNHLKIIYVLNSFCIANECVNNLQIKVNVMSETVRNGQRV